MKFRSALLVAASLLVTQASVVRADDAKPATTAPASQPATQPGAIDIADAAALEANAGKPVAVVGTVDKATWSKSGKVMRISFKGAEKTKFEAVIFSKNKDALDKKFGGDAAGTLADTKVKLTGTLSTYAPQNRPDDKHPQIVIQDVNQIEPADAASKK